MRVDFGALKQIRERAKAKVEDEGRTFLERWWSEKYGLPANDERFSGRSLASLLQEFYEDLAIERRKVKKGLEDIETTGREELKRRLRLLDHILEGDVDDGDFDPDRDPEMERWLEKMRAGERIIPK